MAVRFRSKVFLSLAGEQYKIEISDSDFSGTVFEFETAPPGFEINWPGENRNRHNPVVGSTCEVVMYLENPTLNNFVGALAEGPEGRFTLAAYRYVSGSPVLFWAGVVQSEVSEVEDAESPAFRVVAGDGLATLNNVDYLDDGTPYEGLDRLSEIVAKCLKKIPHVPVYFSSANPFLITSINAYEAQHTYAAANDPLYYTSVDQEAFITWDTNGGYKVKNCFEVLAEVCKIMMGRLLLSEGVWRIEGIESRAFASGSYWRKYPYAMGSPTAYTQDADQGGNPFHPRLATVTYGYMPPLQRVKVKQYIGNLRNLVQGDQFSSTVSGPYSHTIFYDGLESTIHLSGSVEWSFTNVSITDLLGLGFTHFIMFYAYFKVGSLYLRRNFTFNNNAAVAGPYVWAAGGTYKFTTKPIYPIPTVGNETHDITTFDPIFEVDASLVGQQTTLLDFGVTGVYRSNGTLVDPSKYTLTWKINDLYLTVTQDETDKAAKVNPKESITYTATNAAQVNTETLEIDVLLGDAEDLNPAGALRFFDGVEYVKTEDWAMRAAGGDGKLAQVLANRVLAGQTVPTRTMNGAVIGASIWQLAHIVREEDGHQWMSNGVKFRAAEDEMSGSWFDLAYSDEPPVIEAPPYDPGLYGLSRPGRPGIETLASNSLTASLPSVGAQSVGALAFTFTAEPLAEGAVTDFDVTDAVAANLKVGDELILVHPVTNESVVFTMTTASLDGDTNIVASGTIPEGGFPANTPVIYGQQNLYGAGATPAVGTVTSVGMTVPTDILSVAGSPITTAGTLAVTKANQSANFGFFGPTSGGAAAPTFRSMVTADIPNSTVTYAKIQNVTASRLLGNPGVSAGSPSEIPIGAGLAFTGGSLIATAIGLGTSTVENGLTYNSGTSKINWGGALVQDTTITQTGFRIRFTGHYTGIHKTSNNPTPRAVLSVDGLSVAAPTSVATPAEDAIATFTATSGGTQVDSQMRVGSYSTATNGLFVQVSKLTAYDVQYPMRLQPLGGKFAVGKFGATPPTAYATIFGTGLGTGATLSHSVLHLAQTGESSTRAQLSLGTNDTLSSLIMYDAVNAALRYHTHISGTSVTHRWSSGTTEWGDIMVLQPSAATSLARLGAGFASPTGLHSTVHSGGSWASGMLETSGAPTFDETKHEVWYTGSTNQTYTIPAASSCTGREYWIGHAGSAGTITLSQSVSAGNGVTITTIGPGELVKMKAGIANWRGHKW